MISRRIEGALLALGLVAGMRQEIQAQVPLEDEFVVNETTRGRQAEPEAIALDDERFLLLWDDTPRTDPVRGRVVEAIGPPSPELDLNPPLAFTYGYPRGHVNAMGALWILIHTPGGPFAQRVALGGALQGSPIRVQEGLASGPSNIFVRLDGSFVVSWQASDPLDEVLLQQIYFRIFDAQGVPTSAAQRVSEPPGVHHYEPEISGADDGSFVIAWSQDEAPESETLDAYLRRFAPDGTPRGPQEPLSIAQTGRQKLTGLDCEPRGNCVAAFESYAGSANRLDVFYRLWDEAGNPRTGDVPVNQYRSDFQYEAAVSMNASGEFAVSWTSQVQNGAYMDIYARLFRPDGAAASDEFQVNQLAPWSEEAKSSIALNDAGTLLVTWENYDSGDQDDSAIMARRFLRGCENGGAFLSLVAGRYDVCARFETAAERGPAVPWALEERTGAFWFFDPDILELVVKVLDGCGYNGSTWVFAAGLTDVGVDLSVRDRWTGRTRTYWSPPGFPFSSILDIEALPGCATGPGGESSPGRAEPPLSVQKNLLGQFEKVGQVKPTSDCIPGLEAICLQGGRFRVSATWRAFDGSAGQAISVPLSDDSGLFWFFTEDNLELFVKVIDGCSYNGEYWAYATGLTNVEVHLLVEETISQRTWTAASALGSPFGPTFDIGAFSCLP